MKLMYLIPMKHIQLVLVLSACLNVQMSAGVFHNRHAHQAGFSYQHEMVEDGHLFLSVVNNKKSAAINDYKFEAKGVNCGDDKSKMTYWGNDDAQECLSKCTEDTRCLGFAFGKKTEVYQLSSSCYSCVHYKHGCSAKYQSSASEAACGPLHSYTKAEPLPVGWFVQVAMAKDHLGKLFYWQDGQEAVWVSPVQATSTNKKASTSDSTSDSTATTTEAFKEVEFGDKTGTFGSLEIPAGPDLQQEAEEGILQYLTSNNYVYLRPVLAPPMMIFGVSGSGSPSPSPVVAPTSFYAVSTRSVNETGDGEKRRYGVTFSWFAGENMVLPGKAIRPDAEKLKVLINIEAEEGFDVDLVKFVRSLLLEPQQLQQFETKLQESGVFKVVQFGENKKLVKELAANIEMADGAKAKLQRMLDDLSAEEKEKLNEKGKLTPEDKADQEERLARVEAMKEETEAQAAQLKDALEKKTAEAQGTVSAASQAERERMQAQLDELNAETVELDINKGKMVLEEAKSGGYDDGYSLGFMDLLQRNGIFRGMVIGSRADEVTPPAKAISVQFTAQTLKMDRSSLESNCILIPEESTTEKSLEYKSASQMAGVSRVIDSLGMSAAESDSISFQASGGYSGIGGSVSVSASGSSSSSSAKASNQDSSKTVTTSGTGNELYKLKVIDEPRAKVLLDSRMLQPSEELQEAIIQFQTEYESGIDLNTAAYKLYKEFGTHVCPSVTLGGMWEIRANYVSKSSKSNSEMSRVCTEAIQSAQEKSIAVSASGSGYGFSGSASFQGGSSGSSSTQKGSASKKASAVENKNERVEVEQEWKGGASGFSGMDWRASLAITKNSNWKIIDTDLDSCIAHWKWVTPKHMGSIFISTGSEIEFSRHPSKYLGGYAAGDSTSRSISAGQARCQELGAGVCSGITCNSAETSCTVRAGTTLGNSPSGEVTYKMEADSTDGCTKWATEGWTKGTYSVALKPSDAPNGKQWTWQQCAARCGAAGTSVCTYWTLQQGWPRKCLLMKDKGQYQKGTGHYEGDPCLTNTKDAGYACHRYEPGEDDAWCQSAGAPFHFTRGQNAAYPGCGKCWCCKDVSGTTFKKVRQNLFDAYRSLYFPTGLDIRLDADLADAWVAIQSGGFEENSGTCGTQKTLATQEQKDNSCQGNMKCWQKGKTYDADGKQVVAKVGCNNKPCCTKMANFPDGADCCGLKLQPGIQVCKAGSECRHCKCAAPTTTTTTTTTTVNQVHYYYRHATGLNTVALCDAGQKVVGGGCKATTRPWLIGDSIPHVSPDGRQGWYCGGHGTNKEAWAICASGNAPISWHRQTGGDITSVHCPAGAKVIGGGYAARQPPHYVALCKPIGLHTRTPGWECQGHGGGKEVFVMCAKNIMPTVVEAEGNFATCPAGQVILGGGCWNRAPPHKHNWDAPVGNNKWRCSGHSWKPKKVWAVCGPARWLLPR